MKLIPQDLTNRISDFSIGDNAYWKSVFSKCLNELNQFSDEALVDKYLCRLNVSVDEFVLDFRTFVSFVKHYKFYDKLIGRVFKFCSEYDHPCIDVMHHELLDMGMIHERPGEHYINMFNKCLREILLRNKID